MMLTASGQLPWRAISIVFALGLMAGCGGGGGGGGITYDGITSQATVTSGNAAALSGGAYRSGDAGTSVSAPIAVVPTGSEPAAARSLRIAAALHDALSKVDMQGGGSAKATGATAQQSIPGACGGSASYSVSYNEATGSFSGNFSFNGYCEAGETISGSMSFSGLLNIATEDFISFDIAVNNLSVSDGTGSFAIAGNIAFSFPSPDVMMVRETFNIRDASGTVYRVEDFVVSVNTNFNEVELSGRFYHPDHGYVVVATNPAFYVPFGSSAPESGSMTITGVNGGAKLSALTGGNYELYLDSNNDGTYETLLSSGSWASL